VSKKSAKKLEYEKTLNDIFGTNIKWSKLSIHDLEQLVTILAYHPERLCQNVCADKINKSSVLAQLIDQVIPPKYQGPIIKGFKALILNMPSSNGEEEEENEESK